ncbi:MAG TPA: Wzz/FepE/Etk N-terminal domain-containing protein, partial [Vicinamibacterales bacterium]
MHEDAEPTLQLPTLRQLVIPLFRHRTAVLVTFAVLAAAVVLVMVLLPRVYQAEMKLLVNRERVDTIMTSNAQSQGTVPAEISEGELYGEVELIQSREVLERVVTAIGLDRFLPERIASEPAQARMAAAVEAVRDDLTVDPIRKTTMIRVAYKSQDPQLAARVLKELSTVYLEKHLAVRRPAGAYDFFTQQTQRYTEELDTAQRALAAFAQRERVVAPTTEKEIMLRKQNEFESDLDRTEATIADLTRRLDEIERQIRTTPNRQVTQVRDVGNIEMLRGLKNDILKLEIERSDMLTKFTSTYPPLVRLEERLAQLREAQ